MGLLAPLATPFPSVFFIVFYKMACFSLQNELYAKNADLQQKSCKHAWWFATYLYVALQEMREIKAKEGVTLPEVEFDFRFDVGSFFDYYPIDVTAFAKYIGMNASVLRQYVTGLREPKEETIKRIREGIDKLSRDLGMNLMVERPPVSYVE